MATTEVQPTGTPNDGYFKAGFFVGALAVAGAISLANDVGHAGFLNASLYIPGNDWGPAASQDKQVDIRRGATANGETLGTAQWAVPDLMYIENMQGAGTGTLKGLLVEGAVCTLLCRWGLPGSTDWALTQRAYAFTVTLGKRWPTGESGGKQAYQQVVATAPNPVEDVAITT